MKTDDIIAAVLASGQYKADPDRGTLTGPRGHILACPPDRDGYRSVTLCFGKRRVNARLHRIIAAAAWGIDAIRGREVGHRNGNVNDNSIDNLWLPENQTDHYHHDNVIKPKYRGGAPLKKEWPPCVRCGTMGGPSLSGCKSPARVNGQRLGIDGKLCWHCYRALDERSRRKQRKEAA